MACILSRIQDQDVAGWWNSREVTSQDTCGYVQISTHAKVVGLIRYYVSIYVAGAGSLNYDIWGTRNEDKGACEWSGWIAKPQNEMNRYGHYITDAACALIHAWIDEPPPEEELPEPIEEPPEDVPGEPPGDEGLLQRVATWIVDKLNVKLDKVIALFDDVKDFITGVGQAFSNLKDNLIDAIQEMWSQLTTFFENLGDQIKTAVEDIVQKVADIVGDVVEWIKDLGTQIKDALKDAFEWVALNLKDMFVDIWEWIKNVAESIKNAIVDAFSTIKEWFTDAIGWIKEKFIDIKDAVISGITSVVEWIRDVVQAIVEGIGQFVTEFASVMADFWETFKMWWEDQLNVDDEEVAERFKRTVEMQKRVWKEMED